MSIKSRIRKWLGVISTDVTEAYIAVVEARIAAAEQRNAELAAELERVRAASKKSDSDVLAAALDAAGKMVTVSRRASDSALASYLSDLGEILTAEPN
jgi:hypothetical protein